MKTKNITILTLGAVMLACFVTGCSTSKQRSVAARPLMGSNTVVVDLKKYEVVSVVPFTEPVNKDPADPGGAGERLATDVAARLSNDFGKLFHQARLAPPEGKTNELVVTGCIRTYIPGSRVGRLFMIGVTPSVLKGDLVLKDAASQKELFAGPFDRSEERRVGKEC